MSSALSLKLICREIKGLSRRKFYEAFKGGVGEACKLSGVPESKAYEGRSNADVEREILEDEPATPYVV